jgi:hypothetical protein
MSEENDALAQRSWELAIQHDPNALEGSTPRAQFGTNQIMTSRA